MKTAFYVVQLLLFSSTMAKQSSMGLKPMYMPGQSFCEAEDELFADNLLQEKQEIVFFGDDFKSSMQKSAKSLVQHSKSSQAFTFRIALKEEDEKFLVQSEAPLLEFKHSGKDIIDLVDKVIADNLA
jgi:hypothetical protein